MSRSVPWRNKPTNLITQMLPVASQYKLYLVHETGPTSFVFKDDNDNKFKVSIGGKVSCSCGIVQNDHCIHTLYVLLKKFKVPPNNPIIWQASYLDSELQGFVQLKYAEKRKEPTKKHQFKRTSKTTATQEPEDFPPLDEDSMCPICYEEMNGECYSTCKICKKSLHTKCFKVWTRHKEDSNLAVTCPMCRGEFQNPMVIIYKDFQRWENRFSTHKGTLCKGCGMKNIKGMIYKCLLCHNTDLCKMCFQGNQHGQHDRFFVKTLANDSWKAIQPRQKKTKKQLFQPFKELTQKQLSEFEGEQFIIDLFPTLKDFNAGQNTVELGIIGNQILPKQMCFKCKTGGSQLMKRLWCGHAVHEECLHSMLQNKQYLCEIDNQIIAPGYFQALGIKVAKNKRKNVECVVLKNQQAIKKIQSNIHHMEVHGFVPVVPKEKEKRNQSVNHPVSKSRDKNFRIMKKTALQKKQEPFGAGNLGMIMVTGLSQPGSTQPSSQFVPFNLPPKMKSSIKASNYR